MVTLAAVLSALGHPGVLVTALLLKWWAIWFTLGHFFMRTTLLLLAAVSCSWAGTQILLASGAIGPLKLQVGGGSLAPEDPSWFAWIVAILTAWAALGALEAMVLRWGMRKWSRAAWSWRRSDLWVYLSWHGVVILLATWIAVSDLGQA